MHPSFTFTLIGNPIPRKRPRFARRGKFVQTYNPQNKEDDILKVQIKAIMKQRPLLTKPLTVEITFCIERPKSHYRSGKNSHLLKNTAPIYHLKKPDVDNYVKRILDCFNGLVWVDDSQVVKLVATKIYERYAPRTIVTLSEFFL